MGDRITRNQVIEGYRLLLGRDPESESVIEAHLAAKWDLWQFLRVVADSAEGQRRQLDRSSGLFIDQPPTSIEVDATPRETAHLLAETAATWSRFGDTAPFWSVLTDDKYRPEALDDTTREQFYASGADELADFTAACARNGIRPDRNATILELGCGVGRISEHLARAFARYTGVDISPPHLDIAGQRLASQDLDNIRLLTLPEFLENPPPFDILYTILTLQHSPPPVMLTVLKSCFAALRPGGIGFVQLPCYLHDYQFRVADYASRTPRDLMEMHALPQAQVFRALAENGLIPLEVVPYPRIGTIGFSFAFLVAKPG